MNQIKLIGTIIVGSCLVLFPIQGATTPVGYPCEPPPSDYEVIAAPLDINTDSFMELLRKISEGLDQIPNKPIKFEPGKGVGIKVEVRQKEFCCEGTVKTKQKYEGSATIDVGTLGGSGPVPYLYYPGVGGFTFGVSGSVATAFSVKSDYADCAGENDVCGSVNVSASVSSEVTAQILDEALLSIKGSIDLTVSGGAEYCLKEGLKNPELNLCVRLGKVIARTFWHTFTITEGYPIGGCGA